jgi:hypothetical protein
MLHLTEQSEQLLLIVEQTAVADFTQVACVEDRQRVMAC